MRVTAGAPLYLEDADLEPAQLRVRPATSSGIAQLSEVYMPAAAERVTTTSSTGPRVECAVTPDDLTPERAHEIMQQHLRCSTATCRYRKAALAALIAAGRYRLP